MAKVTTIKSLTLAGFITLMTSFVAFKSGTFDKYIKAESDGLPADTPASKTEETVKRSPSLMSGSKSRTAVDQQVKFKVKENEKHSPSMMGSSKSMTLTDQELKFLSIPVDSFLKEEMKLRRNDSLKADSLKQIPGK